MSSDGITAGVTLHAGITGVWRHAGIAGADPSCQYHRSCQYPQYLPCCRFGKRAIHIGVSDCLFAPLRIDDIKKTVENSIKRANSIGDWTRREVKLTTASLQKRVDELQKFDTILEHIEDGVIILDDKHKILLINAAARRTFGLWQDDSREAGVVGGLCQRERHEVECLVRRQTVYASDFTQVSSHALGSSDDAHVGNRAPPMASAGSPALRRRCANPSK